MAKYRKINIEISRTGYGQYLITAIYKGKNIKVYTTDSECYDYLNDDSNKIKHKEAKRHAYFKILSAYNNL